jgi:preprotein translocase subunit SecG
MLSFFIGTLLTLSSLFLIALVLIQQGKGGGLAGAFGGMGGQSAFGTKAGDVFTRVTIITALVWIFFCMLAIKLIGKDSGSKRSADRLAPAPAAAPAIPGLPGTGTPATGTPATGTAPSGTAPAAPDTTTAAPTPDPMTPAATTPAPMTPAATTPPATPEASTPAPATPAPATPSTPATPEGK